MSIKIYNSSFLLTAYADDFVSFNCKTELNGSGNFEIKLPFSSENMSIFAINNVVKYNEFIGIINTINVTVDKNGYNMLVKGNEISELLNRRIAVDANGTGSGLVETMLRNMINMNIITCADNARNYAFVKLGDYQNHNVSYSYEKQVDTVLNVIKTIGDKTDLFIKCSLNPASVGSAYNFLTIDILKAVDKTISSSNPVIISTKFDNVAEFEYAKSIINYSNALCGKGMGNAMYLYPTAITGINRIEKILDLSSVSNKKTNVATSTPMDMTNEEYLNVLSPLVADAMTKQKMTDTYWFRIDNDTAKTLNVGDIITFKDDIFGISDNKKIEAINRIYENNTEVVNLTFGNKNY